MSLIRSIEALLFQKHSKYIMHPILDFGCGDGFFAETVFKNKIDIGLDLKTNPRVKESKKRTIYKKIICYDGHTIPIPNDSVQTIISNCVFEHIPDIKKSLSEIHRILKPGGYLLTSVMTSKWSDNMFGTRIFGKKYAQWMNKKQEHHSLLSEKQWLNLFKEHHLKVTKKVGYLNKQQSQYLDILHYISLPSLFSYMLFKKWILFPGFFDILPIHKYIHHIIKKGGKNYSARFFILKKQYS